MTTAIRGGSGQEALHADAERGREPAADYAFDAESDPVTFDEDDFPDTPRLEFFNAR